MKNISLLITWHGRPLGFKAGICPLEIDFLLRNTLISLYELHFCKILPPPKVVPLPLEIGHRTPMYAGFITNVNRCSNNVNQLAINALECMKKEEEYSNYVANKTTNERFECSLHYYTNLTKILRV